MSTQNEPPSELTLNDVAAAYTSSGHHAELGAFADALVALGLIDADVEDMLRVIARGDRVRRADTKATKFAAVPFPPATLDSVIESIGGDNDSPLHALRQTLPAVSTSASLPAGSPASPTTSGPDSHIWGFRRSHQELFGSGSVRVSSSLELEAEADLVETLRTYVLLRHKSGVQPDTLTSGGDLAAIAELTLFSSQSAFRPLRHAMYAIEDYWDTGMKSAQSPGERSAVTSTANRLAALCEQLRFRTNVIEDYEPEFLRPPDAPDLTFLTITRALRASPLMARDRMSAWRASIAFMALMGNDRTPAGILHRDASESHIRSARLALSRAAPSTELGVRQWTGWQRTIFRHSRIAQDVAASIEAERNRDVRGKAFAFVEEAALRSSDPAKITAAELLAATGSPMAAIVALRGLGALPGGRTPSLAKTARIVLGQFLEGQEVDSLELRKAMTRTIGLTHFESSIFAAGLTRRPDAEEFLEQVIVALTAYENAAKRREQDPADAQRLLHHARVQRDLHAPRMDRSQGTPILITEAAPKDRAVSYGELLFSLDDEAQQRDVISGLLALNDPKDGLPDEHAVLRALRNCIEARDTRMALERARTVLSAPFDGLAFQRSIVTRTQQDSEDDRREPPTRDVADTLRLVCDVLNHYAVAPNFPDTGVVENLATFVDAITGVASPEPEQHVSSGQRNDRTPAQHPGITLRDLGQSLAWAHTNSAAYWAQLDNMVTALNAGGQIIGPEMQQLIRTGTEKKLPFDPASLSAEPIQERALMAVVNIVNKGLPDGPRSRYKDDVRGIKRLIRQARLLNKIGAIDGTSPLSPAALHDIETAAEGLRTPSRNDSQVLRGGHLLTPQTRTFDDVVAALRGWTGGVSAALHPEALDELSAARGRPSTREAIIAGEAAVRPRVLRKQIALAYEGTDDSALSYKTALPHFFEELSRVDAHQRRIGELVTYERLPLGKWVDDLRQSIHPTEAVNDLSPHMSVG